jgi:hypothetical protein
MEELLQAADALMAANPNEPPRPDFPIPETVRTELLMDCKEGKKGRGWFARQPIAAGTVLMVDKPLAMVMDWQESPHATDGDNFDGNGQEEEEKGASILNDLMLLELLKAIQQNPSLWTDMLSNLHPRDNEIAASLPVWLCQDDSLFCSIEAQIQQLSKHFADSNEIAKRLPLVVRYNVLSIETCPELLIYPGPAGHSALSGTGLYYLPSFFNHDSKPNASRWAVGDIMWFVANQDIASGQEICISYLEHDVLCESPARRTIMIDMDFTEGQESEEEEDGPLFPVVDSEVQNELMAMNPLERLVVIKGLMKQATGESPHDEEIQADQDAMEVNEPAWFQCDAHNLRVIEAITLDGLGQPEEALKIWEQCVAFTETMLPPNDESSVVMRVQAALCAKHAGNTAAANAHAAATILTHNLIFGGGISRFRRRYERELQMKLRPDTDAMTDADALWPIIC